MDFIDRLKALSVRVQTHAPKVQTEEATKTALVLPFLSVLGYDIFDPAEVVPEYIADVAQKRGEKVDYAILRDGAPIIILECKHVRSNLNLENASQLYRYFTTTESRFGVLTNGMVYRFYSDLDEPNKMDSGPFLEFDLSNFTPDAVENLKRFAKDSFDLEDTIRAATDLKYTTAIKRLLADQLRRPYENFVLFILGEVYKGVKTKNVREQFMGLAKRAFREFINDRVNDRLKSALESESSNDPSPIETEEISDQPQQEEPGDSGIVTTEEEIQAYAIVKSVLVGIVDMDRVTMRDHKSFCNILLDNTVRRNICRLRFGSQDKSVGVINSNLEEVQFPISSINDIYDLKDVLRERVSFLLSKFDS